MGGKALNKYGVYTERKNTDEFLRIGEEVKLAVESRYPVNTEIVTCYHTKPNHGDLDLLIRMDVGIEIDWRKGIQSMFNPKAIHNNGGVYSFDYKNFQIDFIPVNAVKWETALVYYSYDPLGNIMGKTFHKFGLSYGWDGLFYKFRNFSGANSKNLLISNNARKIFEFGGYDYDRYLQGFETLEDIFKFAISGKYFDSEMFQFENLKSIDKKRNRKRGSYHTYLTYLKDNQINVKYDFMKNKDLYLPMIEKTFPEAKLLERLKALKEHDKMLKIISQKFNGDIVMTWLPNLQGKELGRAMRNFKEFLGDDYNEFILDNTYETIRESFMKTYITIP